MPGKLAKCVSESVHEGVYRDGQAGQGTELGRLTLKITGKPH